MVASLQGLREDVEHARCVAACGVVAVLLLVALNDICAPRPVNCEVHPGQAPLSFPQKLTTSSRSKVTPEATRKRATHSSFFF